MLTVRSSPSRQSRACDADTAAEGLDPHRPGDVGEADIAGEAFDHEIAGHGRDRDRRAEGPQIELDLRGHLNVEVGFDDVVVATFDEAMVGVDVDDVAVLRDLELDVVEPLARRAAHRFDDDLVAAAASDVDASGERLQANRAAWLQRQRAVDVLGFARPAVLIRSRSRSRSRSRCAAAGAARTRANSRAKTGATLGIIGDLANTGYRRGRREQGLR